MTLGEKKAAASPCALVFWTGATGMFDIGPEWDDVHLRSDDFPDLRRKRGRDMVEHFTAIDIP